MKAAWTGIILVIFSFLSCIFISGEEICKSTQKCECINITSLGNLEFQCPPSNFEENKTVIHVYQSAKKIRIDCANVENLNDAFLPDTNLSMATRLEILGCPLPKGGFTDLVKQFSLENLEYLRFEEHELIKPLTISDMQELKNLKTFELKDNNMSILDGEIFKNSPILNDLSIEGNKLILNENIFENVPNLLFLNIANNDIDNIPKNTLKNLVHLKKLELWGNRIKIIKQGIFDSLINLSTLELSLNEIEIIENTAFNKLKNLKNLSLKKNKLKNISRTIFENCHSLQLIRINENQNIILLDDVFSDFTELKSVNLASNKLDNISENLFRGSTNLLNIDLSSNRLKMLPNKVFFNLEKLEELYLQHNILDIIDEGLFATLTNLKVINLSFNKIVRLSPNCLTKNKYLQTFQMSHNQFDFQESNEVPNNLFSGFSSTNLKELDLSYNNITKYPYQLNRIATMENIQLQHNKITDIVVDLLTTMTETLYIDLRFNKINRIDFSNPDLTQTYPDNLRTDIQIKGNPINCDCHALHLARYIQDSHPIKKYLVLEYDILKCAGPQKLINQSLDEVDMDQLTCTLDRNCTSEQSCDCIYRPSDKTMVVDCSQKNLSSVPQLNSLSGYEKNFYFVDVNQTEIHLENNALLMGPSEFDGYQNTSRWFLRGNAIRNISWIPDSLRMLDLRENKIETMDAYDSKLLNESKLDNIYLGNNPWICECGLEDFLIYLRDHINQIDILNLHCNNTNIRLVDLNEKDLCPAETDVFLNVTVVALFCLFIVTSGISLYFLYKKEIDIWVYARGYCLWLVKEEELDKDKIYDAFISFSNKDEDFVIQNLVSVLETGRTPYKLCIHFRDWIPGELIQTQIMHSVRDSRRTIVVLSANFLESIWGIVEFKTAHNEAMREKRARVIIIIYGDVNMEALDDDLKAYLKTNTYIKWGDPWFWDKLKFALPRRGGQQVLSTKHANMMQYIEDKFKLIDKEPSRGVSTPIILSPADLEEKPLTRIV